MTSNSPPKSSIVGLRCRKSCAESTTTTHPSHKKQKKSMTTVKQEITPKSNTPLSTKKSSKKKHPSHAKQTAKRAGKHVSLRIPASLDTKIMRADFATKQTEQKTTHAVGENLLLAHRSTLQHLCRCLSVMLHHFILFDQTIKGFLWRTSCALLQTKHVSCSFHCQGSSIAVITTN